MAKHNIVFGTLSGKIGNIVFFRRKGRQVERALVPSPSDPKTIAQGVVRARFANNKNLWKLLLPYVGNAWKGVSRYGYGGNAFYKFNISNMPTCSLAMSRDGNALPNLGPVTYGGLELPYTLKLQSISTFTYATNIMVPRVSANTVGRLASFIKDNNEYIQEGDIIHLLGITANADDIQLSPATTNNFATSVIHAALPIETQDSTSLSQLMPNFGITYASVSGELSPLAFNFILPSPAADYDSDRVIAAMAMFIERPSRPQRSRYTRCFWQLSTDNSNSLKAACAKGNVANSFGRTFANI